MTQSKFDLRDDISSMEDFSSDNEHDQIIKAQGNTTADSTEPEGVPVVESDLFGELEFKEDVASLLNKNDYSLVMMALESGYRIRKARKSMQSTLNSEAEQIVKNYEKRREKLEKFAKTSRYIRLKDKLCFVIGTLIMVSFSYLMGAAPNRGLYLFSSVLIPFMILVRFIQYYKKKMHYFLSDFCYFGNMIIYSFLMFMPKNQILFKVAFLFANGPLAHATAAFSNALVYHNIDKLTSLGIHAVPLCLMVNFRWVTLPHEATLPENERHFLTFDQSEQTWSDFFTDMFFWPITFYMCWAALYFTINFVINPDKFEKQNYKSLYVYFTEKKWAAKYFEQVGPKIAPVLFQFCHFLFFLVTHCFAVICFYYKYLNVALVIFELTVAFWNGAGYYMQYFSRNYER